MHTARLPIVSRCILCWGEGGGCEYPPLWDPEVPCLGVRAHSRCPISGTGWVPNPWGPMFGGVEGGWVPIPKVPCSGEWLPSHPQTYQPLNIFPPPPRQTYSLPPSGHTPWKGPGTRDTLERNGIRNAHSPPLWTDKHLWKHNLPATSLADGNKYELFCACGNLFLLH